MKRREFIRTGIGAAAFAGASLSFPFNKLWSNPTSPLPFNMIAIKGGEAERFEQNANLF